MVSLEKRNPRDGDAIWPDGWDMWENILAEEHPFSDSSFPGCEFRLPAGNGLYKLAINITITGRMSRKENRMGQYGFRCRIEFVGDGEPSTFTSGWIFLIEPKN